MVRSVSATLEAAQSAASRTPYTHLLFTSYDGQTTYDLSPDGAYGKRILLIDHNEEPYNDYAVIVLRNYDRGLPTNLTGYWTEIGHGDVTGEGNEYVATARLWVKHHQEVSAGGKLLTILELEGMWAKLRETYFRLGNPPYYRARNIDPEEGDYDLEDSTPYGIVGKVLAEIVPAMSLAALVEDDGIVNTYVPDFVINETEIFEDGGGIVYRLIKMTKSFLKPDATLEFEVKYPQTTDAVDLTYYSSQSPYFYEYTERKNLLVPNHIYLLANAGTDGLWTNVILAEASDADSIARYGDAPMVVQAPGIDSQGDADNRAAVILSRIKAEVLAGMLVIPHDCRMELYDVPQINDSRGL